MTNFEDNVFTETEVGVQVWAPWGIRVWAPSLSRRRPDRVLLVLHDQAFVCCRLRRYKKLASFPLLKSDWEESSRDNACFNQSRHKAVVTMKDTVEKCNFKRPQLKLLIKKGRRVLKEESVCLGTFLKEVCTNREVLVKLSLICQKQWEVGKGGGSPSKGEGSPSKGEGSPSKGGDSPSKGEDSQEVTHESDTSYETARESLEDEPVSAEPTQEGTVPAAPSETQGLFTQAFGWLVWVVEPFLPAVLSLSMVRECESRTLPGAGAFLFWVKAFLVVLTGLQILSFYKVTIPPPRIPACARWYAEDVRHNVLWVVLLEAVQLAVSLAVLPYCWLLHDLQLRPMDAVEVLVMLHPFLYAVSLFRRAHYRRR